MICLNILLTVNDPGDVESARGLLAEQAPFTRAEPGCSRFEVYQSQNDASLFILNERWESQAALDAHRQAKAYTEIYQPQVIPRVTRTPHPSQLVE